MRKILLVFVACGSILGMQAHALEIHLKLGGGVSWLSPSDVNRALLDWVERQKLESAAKDTWTYLGGQEPQIQLGYSFEGELQVFFTRRLAISVGSGFLYTDLSAADTEIQINKPQGLTLLVQPRTLSAVPFLFSLYYHVPLTARFRAYAKAGAGFVWAKHVEREGSKKATSKRYNYSLEENASASDTTYQAGLGLDFSLESTVRFFLEGSYRWMKLSGFSGDLESGETGALYHFEEYSPDLDFWQVKNRLSVLPPGGETIRAVRETEVDFSGFSLILGVAIRF
jgi:opacity protein-like surface antigen